MRASQRHLYVSLSVAAAILYRAFLGDRDQPPQTEGELEQHMDEAAHAVSIALRIYRLDMPDPLEIPAATIAEGVFFDGGRRLRFRDGRPALDSLGVNKVDLDHALAKRAHIVPESRPEVIVASKFKRPTLDR